MRYEDLTDKDKQVLGLNGCGTKGFKAPNWFFEASCNHHDYGYWIGGTEEDRKNCDLKFYEAMKRDVARQPWYKRPFFYSMAYVYYLAVRLNGSRYFWYGEKREYKGSNS